MKFSKLGFMIATAMFAVGAFADAANVLISFSTEKDYYADGITAVKDGEWYALCWSPREDFGGLNLDCTPADPSDKVLILAPLAKGGCCPSVVFQLDSNEAPTGGYYFVLVLDTRASSESKPSVATTSEDGRCVPATTMNGAIIATTGFAASSGAGYNGTEAANVEEGTVAWSPVQPKITNFGVVGGKVNITVSGIMPGVTYKVRMGDTPSTVTTYNMNFQSGTGTVEFKELDPGTARFFTVVGE